MASQHYSNRLLSGDESKPSSAGRTPTSSELAEAEAKRRKVQRACDVCRRWVGALGVLTFEEEDSLRGPDELEFCE